VTFPFSTSHSVRLSESVLSPCERFIGQYANVPRAAPDLCDVVFAVVATQEIPSRGSSHSGKILRYSDLWNCFRPSADPC